jgi:hypothetical protein
VINVWWFIWRVRIAEVFQIGIEIGCGVSDEERELCVVSDEM